MKFRISYVAVFLILLCGQSGNGIVPAYPLFDSSKAPPQVVDFVQRSRQLQIAYLEDANQSLNEALKESQNLYAAPDYQRASPAEQKMLRDRILAVVADRRKSLNEIRSSNPEVNAGIVFPLQVGNIGGWAENGHVMIIESVIDDHRLLIRHFATEQEDEPVVLDGISTAGLADGATVKMNQSLVVSGTTQVGGSTHYVLKPFDMTKYDKSRP